MSRSNKEDREKEIPMGDGLLNNAKRSLLGRRRSIDDAVDGASEVEDPKKTKNKEDY
jgi:hypothetical protein